MEMTHTDTTSKTIERIRRLAPHAEIEIGEWERLGEWSRSDTRLVFVTMGGDSWLDARGTLSIFETRLKNGGVRSRLGRITCRGFGGKTSPLTFNRKNADWGDVQRLASYTARISD